MTGSRFCDSNLAYITIDQGKCNKCVHVYANGITCAAFPDGIPSEILIGEFDHSSAYPDDGGIRFKKRK